MNARAVSIDVDMLEHVPKAALEFVAKRKEVEKFLASCAALFRDSPALFKALEALEVAIRFDPDYCYISLSFTGTGDRFGAVWHELRLAGYEPGLRPKKGDTSFNTYWERAESVRLFMSFSSSVCKQVQIGTRTVEQPIYEVQCGDPLPEIEPDPIAPALPAPSAPSTPAGESAGEVLF